MSWRRSDDDDDDDRDTDGDGNKMMIDVDKDNDDEDICKDCTEVVDRLKTSALIGQLVQSRQTCSSFSFATKIMVQVVFLVSRIRWRTKTRS